MSSYPSLGRPTNPGRYSIEEIDDFELLDEGADDTSGFAVKPKPGWYVEVSPGDVKLLTDEQLRDFYRLGVINRQTYLCQSDSHQWLQLSAFVGDEAPQPADDKWHVLMGPGDVRAVTLDQLDDFYRLGVIDGQTSVWQSGMTAWVKLASLIGDEGSQESEDVWYVATAPGEVKQLTLEKLDDYYRYDIIDERTLIWKEGMAQWLPLGTVAGIAAPATTSVAYASVTPIKPAPAFTPSVFPTAAPAYTPSVFPTAPPLAMSIAPPPARSGAERWLLRFAVAAGLLLTLQRNDVLFSAAQASKQQAYYTQLERRYLGGPQFGTARNVEQLVSASGGALPRVRLPWLVEEATHERSLHPAAAPQLTAAMPPATPSAQAQAPAPTPAASAPSRLSSLKKPTAVQSTAPAAKKSPKRSKAAVFSAKGDSNDPLNAKL